eukprot:TRINITY_DN10892_c0_g2_i1.p1 TRINITY_DN10892_c0_g2~~TRINITY_DN10892_c0_g2_i1.p1  ORF type:complete len:122 (-),score=15.65 TRINITY_DN10892_c0_g2_i1:44-409(-)
MVRSSNTLSDFEAELKNPNTWYLVDSVPNPGDVPAVTILVSSPRKSNYKPFSKYDNVKTLYVPLWSFEEISVCYKECFPLLPQDEFMDRYCRFSGVPRFVFVSPDSNEKQDEAIASYDLNY